MKMSARLAVRRWGSEGKCVDRWAEAGAPREEPERERDVRVEEDRISGFRCGSMSSCVVSLRGVEVGGERWKWVELEEEGEGAIAGAWVLVEIDG